ncbi:hypothetical protein HYW75_01260 [Candidatus Pacearchaeota archaeon]|nr:hypothetical protein [Candidatus Pacearchaeota archaeon]
MEAVLKTPEKLVLRVEANEPLLNSIRRSLSEIPTLAIDDVEIFKNDSALYDEVLAHRLGLVVLKTEKSMGVKTKIDFKLSKTGPCTVYAGDMEGAADIIYPKTPITILGEDNKLELIATATLGKGLNHSKYVPGLVYYRFIQEIKSSSEIDKIIQKSKSGLIKPEKKGSKWLCDLNDAEISEIENIEKEAIKDSDEMLLIVESYGNMPAKDLLASSITALSENLDEFEKEIK